MQRTNSTSRSIPQPPPFGNITAGSINRSTLIPNSTNSPLAHGGNSPNNSNTNNGPRRFVVTELTFGETNQVRGVWTQSGKEYLRDVYSLRALLGELGLYPNDEEMSEVLDVFEQKISFNHFLRYVTYLKSVHAHAPTNVSDADTVRAFVALGGDESRQGDISLDTLRDACKRFQLTIDVDAMMAGAEVDAAKGTVDYAEFKQMWERRGGAGHAGSLEGNHSGSIAPTPQATHFASSMAVKGNSPMRGGGGGALGGYKPRARQNSSSTAAEEDLAHMLTTGEDDYDTDDTATLASAPDTPRGGFDVNEASGIDKMSVLRAFLLGVDLAKQQSQAEGPKRRASKRNLSMRRYTQMIGNTLPQIRANNGILATAAEAEKAGNDEEDTKPHQQPEKQGYRAPSPMILSEYTATRHRPEGNKLGFASSPRGGLANASRKGATMGRGGYSATGSPTKSGATSNRSSPRRH